MMVSCSFSGGQKQNVHKVESPRLPYMGNFDVVEVEDNGTVYLDTVYSKIPPFSFINQDGDPVTEKDYENKVYIADFFFTTCPSICPKMTNTLYLVQEQLKGENDFKILSHSIDPDYDTPEVLMDYSIKNKADNQVWDFVTGNRDEIYDICENHYMSHAKKDSTAEGGYIHSGFLILIDKNKYIRGAYDGTMPEMADTIVADVKLLLSE